MDIRDTFKLLQIEAYNQPTYEDAEIFLSLAYKLKRCQDFGSARELIRIHKKAVNLLEDTTENEFLIVTTVPRATKAI